MAASFHPLKVDIAKTTEQALCQSRTYASARLEKLAFSFCNSIFKLSLICLSIQHVHLAVTVRTQSHSIF
jgi:hypothetical protein